MKYALNTQDILGKTNQNTPQNKNETKSNPVKKTENIGKYFEQVHNNSQLCHQEVESRKRKPTDLKHSNFTASKRKLIVVNISDIPMNGNCLSASCFISVLQDIFHMFS